MALNLLILLNLIAVSIREIRQFIKDESVRKGERTKSAAALYAKVAERYPLVREEFVNVKSFRRFLKSLGFKWSRIKNGYYRLVFKRPDVIAHRQLFSPLLFALMQRSDRFLVIFGDASHCNENDISSHGWICEYDADHRFKETGAGKGRRLNLYNWISQYGLIKRGGGEPGEDAGTMQVSQSTLNQDAIVAIDQRLIDSLKEINDGRLIVVILDGATNQKMLPADSIDPPNV